MDYIYSIVDRLAQSSMYVLQWKGINLGRGASVMPRQEQEQARYVDSLENPKCLHFLNEYDTSIYHRELNRLRPAIRYMHIYTYYMDVHVHQSMQ